MNILESYESTIFDYNLSNKVSHIVTDNAANMKCAFSKKDQSIVVSELTTESNDADPDSCRTDANTLNDLSESNSINISGDDVNDVQFDAERLPCVAHTLQLVIKDAIQDCPSVDNVIEKIAKLVTKSHTSNIISEKLQVLKKSFSQRNVTRCNSEYKMLKSFLNFTDTELADLFSENSLPVLSSTQRNLVEEIVSVLEDFAVATELIQTDKFSIGLVIPIYRGLLKELSKLTKLKQCEKFKHSLLNSLKSRFAYLEANNIFPIASILTPHYLKCLCKFDEYNKWDSIIIENVL